jgi:thymidylate synthase
MWTFLGNDVNDVYPDAVRGVLDEGDEVGIDRPEAVDSVTLELNPATVVIDNPRRRLVTSYGRPVNVAFALAEVLWILSGRRDVEMLEHYNSNIGQFSDDGQVFNAAYGHRMRYSFGHDQIEDVIRTLADDHTSRQGVIVISNPVDDKGWNRAGDATDPTTLKYSKKKTKDRACNVSSLFKIRKGRLNLLQVLRSNDIVWGTPYNWMQFMHLQEYFAQRLGVEVGKYTHVADSLHMYRHHFREAQRIDSYDLYAAVGGWDHAPMMVTDEIFNTVLREELAIREGRSLEYTSASKVGAYWSAVLYLFVGHSLYKQDRDLEAFQALLNCGDPVLGLSQIRFCYYHRWHKMPEVVNLIGMYIGGESIASWIMDARADNEVEVGA